MRALFEYVAQDWKSRLPYRIRNNRYRGLSRWAYVILCVMYYTVKDFLLLYFCLILRAYKLILWDVWNWIFKIDKRQWYLNLFQKDSHEQKRTEHDEDCLDEDDTEVNSILEREYISEVKELWELGDEDAWDDALRYYWRKLGTEQYRLEREIMLVSGNDVNEMTVEQFYNFLHDKYFVWKFTQKNRLATSRKHLERYITESRLVELSAIQHQLSNMNLNDISQCLTVAKQIRGLGTAGASGLLSILYPDKFGTVDQFVVKALLQIKTLPEYPMLCTMNPQNLTVEDGVAVIRIMRRMALQLNEKFHSDKWTPRKIDMVLWSIGR